MMLSWREHWGQIFFFECFWKLQQNCRNWTVFPHLHNQPGVTACCSFTVHKSNVMLLPSLVHPFCNVLQFYKVIWQTCFSKAIYLWGCITQNDRGHHHLPPSTNLAAVGHCVYLELEPDKQSIPPSSQHNKQTDKTNRRPDYFSGGKYSDLLTVLSEKGMQQRCEVQVSGTSDKTLPLWSPCLSL